MIKSYTHRCVVNTPLHRVAGFHSRKEAVQKMIPFPLIVRMHGVESLGEGSRSAFTIWMGPFPVYWQAVHHHVNLPHGFSDRQLQGPFRYWNHIHSFRLVNENQTEIVDEVKAETGGLASRLIWFSLPLIFFYRTLIIRREA